MDNLQNVILPALIDIINTKVFLHIVKVRILCIGFIDKQKIL